MYTGWSEEWFSKDGVPIVDELFIKYFVNRFFDFPEDWDEDDVPLIMLFIKCRICECIQEHYIKEDKLNIIYYCDNIEFYYNFDAENFLYNKDDTYTSFSNRFTCRVCNTTWSYYREKIADPEISIIKEIYPHLKFDSQLEILFWKVWNEKSGMPLAVQYQIGRYRVDFAHLPTKTVIEIDGNAYHSTSKQINNDRQRQIEIERKGWKFWRVNEHQLVFDTEHCVLQTLSFLKRAINVFDNERGSHSPLF